MGSDFARDSFLQGVALKADQRVDGGFTLGGMGCDSEGAVLVLDVDLLDIGGDIGQQGADAVL